MTIFLSTLSANYHVSASMQNQALTALFLLYWRVFNSEFNGETALFAPNTLSGFHKY